MSKYRLRKRVASWIMVVSILCGTFVSCLTVRADFLGMTWDEFVDMYGFGLSTTKYLFTSVLGFFTDDLDSYIRMHEDYWQYAKDFEAKYGDDAKAGKEITVDSADVTRLYDLSKDYLTALNGYYLVNPTLSKNEMMSLLPEKALADNGIVRLFNRSDVSIFMADYVSSIPGNEGYVLIPVTNTDFAHFYYDEIYRFINGRSYSINTGPLHVTYGGTVYGYSSGFKTSFLDSMIGMSGMPCRIFYSEKDVKNFLGYNSSFKPEVFLSSNYLNFFPKNYVVSPEKYNADYNAISKSVYEKVMENINQSIATDGKDITYNNYQQIIDNTVHNYIDKGDNSGGGDNPGGDDEPGGRDYTSILLEIRELLNNISGAAEHISANLMVHINAVSSKLKDIADILNPMSSNLTLTSKYLLEINGKLDTVQDKLYTLVSTLFNGFDFQELLDTIKDSGGGGGGSAAGSLVGTVIGNLISDLLDSILNGDETVEDAVSSLTSRFTKVVDVSKTKFPFSLPWDVVLIFETLSHPPETPVVDFPIKVPSLNFNYSIHVDLKDFESLSKTCRAFFAITFALILIKLTLLMINRGDLDA